MHFVWLKVYSIHKGLVESEMRAWINFENVSGQNDSQQRVNFSEQHVNFISRFCERKYSSNSEAKTNGDYDASTEVNNFSKFVGFCEFQHCYNRKLVDFKDVSATEEVHL